MVGTIVVLSLIFTTILSRDSLLLEPIVMGQIMPHGRSSSDHPSSIQSLDTYTYDLMIKNK